MPSKILCSTYFILSCISQTAIAENFAADGVYSPFEADDESSPIVVFRGATLSVYDPLDIPALNKTSDAIIAAEITTPLVQIDQTPTPASNDRRSIAPATPITNPEIAVKSMESTPNLAVARGEITGPPPKQLTDNIVTNLGLTVGAILLSSSLDKAGDRFALDHGQNTTVKAVTKVGNALPFIALGLAGLAVLDSSDPRLSRTGLAALEAGGASAVSAYGLKYVFDRARPEANLGPSSFHSSGTKSSDSSLPSIHTATLWGVITPFAKEYDMPWLYAVGLLTNFSRVADRKHWVSDTIAGSALGYWLGDMAWHHNRLDDRSGTSVSLTNRGIAFSWALR
ncbi:phosphatase PAP2 family protein [Propionivibrio sp.]|uniref:phosphatase PAP2 family protein n=1 Tax=Propionivibrio sp. TaxID=2212460 RepID=UPI003BF24020